MHKQTLTYKSVGDCHIQADIYQPFDDNVHPAIVWLHGGALIFGSRSRINSAQLDLYLKAGYAVVAADYRLAPETRMPDIIEDLRDLFTWLKDSAALLRIDASRLAVVGHSAGGYLTLMAGFLAQPRPRALVTFYGYGDIVGEWYSRPDSFYRQLPLVSEADACSSVGAQPISEALGQTNDERFRFYLYCRQQGLWLQKVVGRDPETEPAAFNPFRPVLHVDTHYPPTLLLHGDQDTDVPYEESVNMAARLAEVGVAHELLTMPGAGHVFDGEMDRPEVARAFRRVLAFLRRYL